MQAAANETPSLGLAASQEAMVALVHVDDCAAGVVAIVENRGMLGVQGVFPVFDLMGSYENLGVVLEQAAQVVGYKGVLEFKGPGEDMFAQCMCTTVRGGRVGRGVCWGGCRGRGQWWRSWRFMLGRFWRQQESS